MAKMRKTMCRVGWIVFATAIACAAPTCAAFVPDGEAQLVQRGLATAENRVLVGEIGFRNTSLDRLKKKYQYPWLYPQAFTIDAKARELFVMLGARSGKNKWGWVQVYDLDSLKLKTTFSTRQHWREGMVVRRIAARRFLYTIGNSSLIRVDITELPKDLGIAATETLPVRAFSLLASDGVHFAAQDRPGSKGPAGPQLFSLYDDSLRKVGNLTLSLDEAIKHRTVPAGGAKMQGVAWGDNRFYASFGAPYVPGYSRKLSAKWQGIAMFDRSGKLLASRVVDPDSMRASLQQAIGYRPTCVENEGVAVADDAVYSIWITLGPKDREKPGNGGKGVVLMRELFTARTDGGDR